MRCNTGCNLPGRISVSPGPRATPSSGPRYFNSQTSNHSSCRTDCSRRQPRRRNPCRPRAARSSLWEALCRKRRKTGRSASPTCRRRDTSGALPGESTTESRKSLCGVRVAKEFQVPQPRKSIKSSRPADGFPVKPSLHYGHCATRGAPPATDLRSSFTDSAILTSGRSASLSGNAHSSW